MSDRVAYYIPPDGYVEDKGFRVSIVKEGEDGHCPTGTWPYTGAVGETMPYFWGHDYEKACEVAEKQNARMGLDSKAVDAIISSSIRARLDSP